MTLFGIYREVREVNPVCLIKEDEELRKCFPGCGPIMATTREVYREKKKKVQTVWALARPEKRREACTPTFCSSPFVIDEPALFKAKMNRSRFSSKTSYLLRLIQATAMINVQPA